MRLAARHILHAADVVDTAARSNAKPLLDDDTVLTLGQRTRMTFDEYLYAPEQGIRRAVIRVERGTLRILVGRAFRGSGSTFAVRAGAVEAITETAYWVLWRHEKETGFVNIGSRGAVMLTAGGGVVILEPGFYSIAPVGKLPSPARLVDATAPPAVRLVIGETEVVEELVSAPGELVAHEIEEELPVCPPDSPPGGICPRKPPPAALPPSTPPAVTSGAIRR
jgi:hypothetical protein